MAVAGDRGRGPLHSLAWSSPLSNSLRKSRLLIWLIDQLINHSIGCCRKGLLNYKTILRFSSLTLASLGDANASWFRCSSEDP
ncbi:hypothetical protein K1719_045421 [Acacia pycnantha]|nr:hypothetical protein K1719_045421 [Acacia pycnantha]